MVLPAVESSGHAYLGASPACWALFGEILAREYGDPAYMAAHRMTVDAYCAQHPGVSERRTIQSINVHLVGLYLTIERQAKPIDTRAAMARLTDKAVSQMMWLAPPPMLGSITVADLHAAGDADAHRAGATAWAKAVWEAWSAHHATIAALARSVA